MCGRFTLSTPVEQIAEAFEITEPLRKVLPRYNIAPTQKITVVAQRGEQRGLGHVRWGMVPNWVDHPSQGPPLINARAESVDFKFRESFHEKRCLIVADGFYEWRTVGRKKHANHFTMTDGAPFAFASIWDVWEDEIQKLFGACLITTTANDLVKSVHDRMPVILPRESYAEWLNPETPVARLKELLKPYPTELMKAKEVGPKVNSTKNEGPDCLEPSATKA